MEKLIKQFIENANLFDVDSALELFAENAVIDDESVGRKFVNKKGVRDYLETFFVGYNTKTQLDLFEITDDFNASIKVDFTGDFGHEKGGLNFSFNKEGLIAKIDAYLE